MWELAGQEYKKNCNHCGAEVIRRVDREHNSCFDCKKKQRQKNSIKYMEREKKKKLSTQ